MQLHLRVTKSIAVYQYSDCNIINNPYKFYFIFEIIINKHIKLLLFLLLYLK